MARFGWFLPVLLISSMSGQDQAPQDQAPAAAQTTPEGEERDVSLNVKKFAGNFFSDQKMIWTFPAKVATGSHLLPTFAIVGVTAGIAAGVDPAEGRFFRRHGESFDSLNSALSEHRTTAATLLTPAALYAAGLIRKDTYLAHTGLFAAEAWVDVTCSAKGFAMLPGGCGRSISPLTETFRIPGSRLAEIL